MSDFSWLAMIDKLTPIKPPSASPEFSSHQAYLDLTFFSVTMNNNGFVTAFTRWMKLLIWLNIQYIPRNMHTVFALLCFVVVIHWLIFPYPSGLLHWHCGNLTIAPVPAKQPWWIWMNTSCEFIMNDCITTIKQSTTKPCAYFLGYTVAGETSQHIESTYIILGL